MEVAMVSDCRNFYGVNRRYFAMSRLAALWDAAKCAWRCRFARD